MMMRKFLLVLVALPLLSGCYVETQTYYQPIFQPAGGVPMQDHLVIQNIHPPFECRVVPVGAPYPPIYRIVSGPDTEREGLKFVRNVCRVRPKEQ